MNKVSKNQLKKIIKKNPNDLQAFKALAGYYADQGEFSESLNYFKHILAFEKNSENFYNLGVIYHQLKHYEIAELMYLYALTFDPQKPEIFSNLGAISRDLHNFNQALVYYQQCIEIAPEKWIEFVNYCSILINLKKYEDALEIINYVILKFGNFEIALLKKYELLIILGLVNQSTALLKQLLDLFPTSFDIKWLQAQQLLFNGNYCEGWKAYESRWESDFAGLTNKYLTQPKWLGNFPIEDKVLLVTSEQGLGDTIQFSRYIPKLSFTKAKIIFVLPKTLLKVLNSLETYSQMISDDVEVPFHDAYVPLLSLPLIFETDLHNIPNQTPYIYPNRDQSLFWNHLIPKDNKLKVGLVWSGGHRPDSPNLFSVNERRNLPIEYLKFLKGIDAAFFSLQKGEPSESELSDLISQGWDGPVILNFSNLLNDFSDTAALIDNLDLVISVDTSTAHLAAAMGKPVWLLNRLDSCWRWFQDIENSPWYPTIKIYRQTKANDWHSVMHRIRSDLISLLLNS